MPTPSSLASARTTALITDLLRALKLAALADAWHRQLSEPGLLDAGFAARVRAWLEAECSARAKRRAPPPVSRTQHACGFGSQPDASAARVFPACRWIIEFDR